MIKLRDFKTNKIIDVDENEIEDISVSPHPDFEKELCSLISIKDSNILYVVKEMPDEINKIINDYRKRFKKEYPKEISKILKNSNLREDAKKKIISIINTINKQNEKITSEVRDEKEFYSRFVEIKESQIKKLWLIILVQLIVITIMILFGVLG